MAYTFTWEDDGLYWKHQGILEARDIIHANDELVGKAEFKRIRYIIWDATDVDAINVDDGLVEISTTFSVTTNKYNPNIKVAFIAHDEHLRLLIKNYIELTLKNLPDAKQELFDDIEQAREFISQGY